MDPLSYASGSSGPTNINTNANASSSRPFRSESYNTDLDEEEDMFDPSGIDPALRLRTTRTAHSVLAESIMIESAQEKRKRKRKELLSTIKRKATMSRGTAPSLIGSIRRNRASTIGAESVTSTDFGSRSQANSEHHHHQPPPPTSTPPTPKPPAKSFGQRLSDIINNKSTAAPSRRMIYVNIPLPSNLIYKNEPLVRYVRNKVRTAKYTIITFLPKNLAEQFRRYANIYFASRTHWKMQAE